MGNGVGRLSRRRWGMPLLFLLATLAAAAAFTANVLLAEVRAGNDWSLAYGIAAAALLLLATAYGVRRRMMRVASRFRAGSAAGWLGLHIWGGSLFLVLMLMHSGFRLPSGAITGWPIDWIVCITSAQTASSDRIASRSRPSMSEKSCPAENTGPCAARMRWVTYWAA